VSRRKVVTEITIETNQVLVIKRKQVTRSRCSECVSEADFEPPDKVNVLADGTGNRQGIEVSFGALHPTDAAGDSHTSYRKSLLRATMLAKRVLNCLRNGRKQESQAPR